MRVLTKTKINILTFDIESLERYCSFFIKKYSKEVVNYFVYCKPKLFVRFKLSNYILGILDVQCLQNIVDVKTYCKR